jgi:hypothetical protein
MRRAAQKQPLLYRRIHAGFLQPMYGWIISICVVARFRPASALDMDLRAAPIGCVAMSFRTFYHEPSLQKIYKKNSAVQPAPLHASLNNRDNILVLENEVILPVNFDLGSRVFVIHDFLTHGNRNFFFFGAGTNRYDHSGLGFFLSGIGNDDAA